MRWEIQRGIPMKVKRDWKAQDEKLIRRGMVEFDPQILKNLDKFLKKINRKKEGRPFSYPDQLIKFIGLIKTKFSMSYRTANGFLFLFSAFFKIPHFSNIFRRMVKLKLNIDETIPPSDEPLFLSIDASGLEADHGGSWLKKHYGRKKQKWIKIHFAIDVKTKRIIDFRVSTDKGSDNKKFRGMVKNISKKRRVGKVAADPGYDDYKNYEILGKNKIRCAIKPKNNANPDAITIRNNVRELYRLKQVLLFQKYSFKTWKQKTGYNYRTLSESVFNSFKSQFGHGVSSKKMHYVRNEITWKVNQYNLNC